VEGCEILRLRPNEDEATLARPVAHTGSREASHTVGSTQAGKPHMYLVETRPPQGLSPFANRWTVLIPGGPGEGACGRPSGATGTAVSYGKSIAADQPTSGEANPLDPEPLGAQAVIQAGQVSGGPAPVPPHWSLIPSGPGAGDRFPTIFLSSTERGASSSDIDAHNSFVQNLAAAGHADIQDYASQFREVACTSAVNARNNTGATGTGVAIYWLSGARVAGNTGTSTTAPGPRSPP
jgi:hypothetical protein